MIPVAVQMEAMASRIETHSFQSIAYMMRRGVDEISRMESDLARVTAERDEARRWYCAVQAGIPDGRPQEFARTLGWDCFDAKEVQP